MEIQNKENEVENMKNRLQKDREEYETDFRDRQLRDLQIIQIKIEERREAMTQREAELRKKWRFLEKKKELLAADWDSLKSKDSSL